MVAATLGVLARARRSRSPTSILDASAHAASSLLVLDNCEHLVDAVGRLAEGLLRDVPGRAHPRDQPRGARRRRRAGVAAARRSTLPGRATSTSTRSRASEAVQLFVERAPAVQPGFALDETNAAAVAEICRRLDGIPLAVELAAARVTIMTPADIAARLDQRFQLLTGGRRSAAERHQTLRGADRVVLRAARRRASGSLFERLGVFPGQLRRRRGRGGRRRRRARGVGRARRRRRAWWRSR